MVPIQGRPLKKKTLIPDKFTRNAIRKSSPIINQ